MKYFGLIQHLSSQGEEIILLPVAVSLVRDYKYQIKSNLSFIIQISNLISRLLYPPTEFLWWNL